MVDAATLVIIFYFGLRSGMLLQGAPITSAGKKPLFLPGGTVRTFIFLGFFSLAVILISQGHALPVTLDKIVNVLEGYALGYVASAVVHRLAHNKPSPGLLLFRHGKALAVLAVTFALCLMFISGRPSWMPATVESLLGPTIAFYFGSRT